VNLSLRNSKKLHRYNELSVPSREAYDIFELLKHRAYIPSREVKDMMTAEPLALSYLQQPVIYVHVLK